MGYILGIDIGIASIGFAGVNHDLKKILFSGVHIFEAAENPKTGASLAEPRRTARGQRRVIHRRAQRKNSIRQLLLRHGLNCLSIVDKKYAPTGKNTPPISPWDLRRAALERKLTDEELVRVLFHIGKHRGFQSNKKNQSNEGDEGKALKGATDLFNKWQDSGLQTIGAYLSTQPKKRNGNESYDNFIKRNWLREEIKFIFDAQRKFGNQKTTQELLLEFAGTGDKSKVNTVEGDGVAFFQRPLQSSEGLIGDCTFEKGEKRAPKFSYTAELFVLWSRLFGDDFRRDGYGTINAALNYGYAVLRAFVARSQVAYGLLPTFGIHHDNELNAFNLTDDMMEVFRPLCDFRVFHMARDGVLSDNGQLTKENRAHLAALSNELCMVDGEKHNVLNAADKMAAGLVGAIERKSAALIPLPEFIVGNDVGT